MDREDALLRQIEFLRERLSRLSDVSLRMQTCIDPRPLPQRVLRVEIRGTGKRQVLECVRPFTQLTRLRHPCERVLVSLFRVIRTGLFTNIWRILSCQTSLAGSALGKTGVLLGFLPVLTVLSWRLYSPSHIDLRAAVCFPGQAAGRFVFDERTYAQLAAPAPVGHLKGSVLP